MGEYYSAYVYASGTKPITLTITAGKLPQGFTFSDGHISGIPSEAGSFTIKVRAWNRAGQSEREFDIKINEASKNDDADTESGQVPGYVYVPDEVPDLVVLRNRNISSLSVSEVNALSNDKSIIAVVMPEMRANKSGTYRFRSVKILAGVAAGAELVWNSFADGSSENDNSYAQFFDGSGGEIFSVPEDMMMNIAVYLEAGKDYAPVITALRPQQSNHEEALGDSRGEGSSGGGGGCNSCTSWIVIAVVFLGVLRKK